MIVHLLYASDINLCMNIGSFLGCGKSEIQAYSVLSREERDRVNGK